MYPSPRGNGLWWAAAGLAVVILLVPFLLVEVPPVQDYPNHLARLYVLADGGRDPILAAMYEPRWSILPNLAIDIIGPPLIQLLPLHVAGKILLAAALLFPLIGVVVYARAAFGAWSAWSLASALVAYNAIFILGFMNFLLSLGVALIGAAAWIALRESRPAAAIVAGAAISAVAFFCHLIGVAFFAVLIGSEEAVRLWTKWRDGRLDLLPHSDRPQRSPWRCCRRSSSTRSRRPRRPMGSHFGARRSASCTNCSCRSWHTTNCSLR